VVSLVFLSPFVGYVLSAALNNYIHLKFGQRGVAVIGPLCHLVSYVIFAVHPPYPVLVVIFMLAGFGNGLEDAGYNAWIGNMANANEVLGFLHGFYGLGATLSPLIATSMIAGAGLSWYYFYYVMVREISTIFAFSTSTSTSCLDRLLTSSRSEQLLSSSPPPSAASGAPPPKSTSARIPVPPTPRAIG
jgi:fucose permease